MSFERPTLSELIARTRADTESRLGSGPLLPVSNAAVLSTVLAGAAYALHGHLDWIARQILPDTAEAELLARHAGIWGIARLAATFAVGTATASGIDGAVIRAGTTLRRADGATYTADADATIVGGTAAVAVTATLAGDAGDAEAGTALRLVSAISGVTADLTVAADGLTGGADQESDAALRARVLARIQAPPHGGNAADYIAWAFAGHPEVTRAWVYPLEIGVGTVTVRFCTDGATVGGIPEAAVVAAVQDYIDTVRPVTAAVEVRAPVALALNLTIAPSPDTAAVRTAIELALADVIRRDGEPGGTIRVSRLREAISGASGEEYHALTSPTADVVYATGRLPVLGTITWI